MKISFEQAYVKSVKPIRSEKYGNKEEVSILDGDSEITLVFAEGVNHQMKEKSIVNGSVSGTMKHSSYRVIFLVNQ